MEKEKIHFAIKVLRAFCPAQLREEIEGDLLQRFERDVKKFTQVADTSKVTSSSSAHRKAKRRLFWNMLRYFRPGILLRNKPSSINSVFMLSNYLKISVRVMLRSKSYSAINVLGLAMGITGSILLFLWISHEFSYDRFHTDKDRIYQVWNREIENGEIECRSTTPRVLAGELAHEYAGIENVASYAAYGSSHLFTAGQTQLVKTSGAYVDAQFLKILSFPLVKGDPSKCLNNPNSIIITESFAKQLLGEKEPLGENITIGESGYSFPFTITGVLKDLPSNTDFHFDYLISFQFLESIGEKDMDWGTNSLSTIVKLRPGVSVADFNVVIKGVVKKHLKESTREIFLYPLTEQHLYSRFQNGVVAGGRIEIIRMLEILGVCLLTIACINFVNLSTARAQKRSKEIGIRKVTGANRSSLVIQFLCESVLVAIGAGIISLIAIYFSLPAFSSLIRQQLHLNITDLLFWASAFVFICLVGIVAGGYPAFYLSSFQPVKVLKGIVSFSSRNRLRQALVVFQFGHAAMLMVAVIAVSKQIHYVQNREAGYNKDRLIYQTLTGDLEKNFQAYKQDLLTSAIASSVTKTSSPITEQWSSSTSIQWRGKDPQDKTSIERFLIDENISSTAGLTILQGRDLNLQQYPTDSSAVLLNEAAAKAMRLTQPVGEIIVDNNIEWHVVGVVKDFVLSSPLQKIRPLILAGCKKNMFSTIHIRFTDQKTIQENISAIKTLNAKYNPAYPFEYQFVDEEYKHKFAGLEATLTITTLFGGIAIIIACLGLLGLSTYMIESRVKEVGIRKVFGSSVVGVVGLLSKDSLKPILLSILLFGPLAWLSMNWWLESFEYRISLHAGLILLAGVAIVLIAWLSISVQTFIAARENPIKSLRSE